MYRPVVSAFLILSMLLPVPLSAGVALDEAIIETVTGPVTAGELGLALEHEHVLVDFIGASEVSRDRYDPDEVFAVARPFLEGAAANGVRALFECTPDFLARDPMLLRRLSEATGIRLITNTGLYGAAGDKFVPEYAYVESAEELARRWIAEAHDGIGDTGIRPGFIKTAVDTDAELSAIDRKLIEAAAITHRNTGLVIAVHTGKGPGLTIIEILRENGVRPDAYVWVHAQNADDAVLRKAAAAGAWISLDGIRPRSLQRHADALGWLKEEGHLQQVLLSHDAGWYDPAKPGGGNYRGYDVLFTEFLPLLRERGVSSDDIDQVLIRNVARAFGKQVRTIADREPLPR